MTNPVSEYMRRPLRYAQADGLNDMGLGLATLGWSLVMFLEMRAPSDSIWSRGQSFPVLALLILGPLFLLIHFGTRYIRSRVTFPRTGYVAYRRQPSKWVMAVALGAGTAAAVALATQSSARLFRGPFLFGLVLGLAYFFAALKQRLGRYWIIGSLSLMLGAAIEIERVELQQATLWYFLLMGAAMLCTGGLTMYLYLRRTHPPETDAS
jgi:hypothetical protein